LSFNETYAYEGYLGENVISTLSLAEIGDMHTGLIIDEISKGHFYKLIIQQLVSLKPTH